MQRHRTVSGQALRSIREPGNVVCGSDDGSIELRDCTLAASDAEGWEADDPADAASSARSETISCFMPETKSCLDTLPVPLGSSAAKMASAPCCWNTAGGFLLWKAWSNWLCVMLPEPEVVIDSHHSDSFCLG